MFRSKSKELPNKEWEVKNYGCENLKNCQIRSEG